MTNELASFAQEWLTFALLLTVQLLLVLALRKPVRAWLGAVACYRLWLLPLLWLPIYLLGPMLFAMLARFGAETPDDNAFFSLRQFMDLDLLLFTAEPTPTSGSMAGNSGAVPGWTLLAVVWACGTLALIAWHCARWLFFSSHVRGSATALSPEERQRYGVDAHVDAQVPASSLPDINSAALFGVTKPVLLLPEDFAERYDANQRHIILAHEAVHLRRKDNAWNLCALLLVALFWINPLILVAWRCFRLDQELSCDALALRRCNDEQQKRYARTLLDSLASLHITRQQPALSAWDNLRHIRERTLMVKQHLQLAVRPRTIRTSLTALALLGASITLMFAELASPAATAGEVATDEPRYADIGEPTSRILSQAIEFLNNDEFDEARATLANLRIENLTPFERSRVHQLLFNLEMNDADYAGAREQLQLAIESGGLNEQETSQMQYQQAQLYVQEERYPEAAEALSRWIAAQDDANGGAYYLLAASHFYMDDFAEALPAAQEAVERGGDSPQEAWLAMLATLHTRLGQTQQAEDVIDRLGELYPASPMYRRLRDEAEQNVR
ncbi:MAG: M56 family metallopeptidase [Pseudomonadota bacterium]|nr:M56 family metallopeptidase [Pseudomonadota bacterium]